MSLIKKIIKAFGSIETPQHTPKSHSTSAGGFTGLAQIQYQDISGNWRSHSFIQPTDTNIRLRMKDVKQSYPNFKVRAVDRDNRVIDITQ